MSLGGLRRQVTSHIQAWRAVEQGRVAIDDILLGATANIPDDPTKRLSEPSPMLRDAIVYDPKGNATITSGLHGDRANAEAFIEVWGVQHAKPEEFGADPETRELYAAISLNNGGRLFVLPKRRTAYVSTPDTPDWERVDGAFAEQLTRAVEDNMIFGNQELAEMKTAIKEAISPADTEPPNPELLRSPRHRYAKDPDQIRTQRWMSDFSDTAHREMQTRKNKHRSGEFAAIQGVYGGHKQVVQRYREYVETRYGPIKDGWDQGLIFGTATGALTVAAQQGWLPGSFRIFARVVEHLPPEVGLAGGAAFALSYGVKKTVDTVGIFRRRRDLRGQLARGITPNLPSAVGIPEVVEPLRPALLLPRYPVVATPAATTPSRANRTVRLGQLGGTAKAAFSAQLRSAQR